MQNKTKFKESEIGMIPEVWGVASFKEILGDKGYIRGPFGSALRRPELKTEGIAVYEQEHAIYNSRNFRYYLDEKKFEELSRFQVKENDLIISCSGTLGKASIISKDDPKGIISQALLILRPDASKIRPLFLKYFIDSPRGFDSLVSRSTGSVQVNIAKREIIEGILLSLPELREQDAIVKFISDIDLKIEINQQMNKNVEAIGEALFKHWFMGFEFPDEKGMPYKSSGGKMVDSELGTIPGGWRCEKLGDVVLINHKSINEGYQEKIIQYIDISSVSAGKLETVNTYNLEEAPSRAKRLVAHGDVIWSCVRPNRKSYLFIHKPPKNLVVSTGFAVLTPKGIPPSFLYCWVTTDEFVDYLAANADGSAYPAVRPEHFSIADILLPPAPLLSRFENVMAPLMEKIAYNEEQCRTLCIIRDMLLPRLMSGQIRVPAG